jgi:F0F1-type ATP synthase assembly protein I
MSNNLKKRRVSTNSNKLQAYAKYSSLALQFALTITLGALVGRGLDSYLNFNTPYLTALFSLAATIGGIYMLVRDLIQKK